MCFRTSDVGLKRIRCARKYESKGEKNSLHHTMKRKTRKITIAAPVAVSAPVTFLCILFNTPSIVHVPPISLAFLTDTLKSMLCISQPNRMWHLPPANQQEKPSVPAAMPSKCLSVIRCLSHYTAQVLIYPSNTWIWI